MFTTSTTVCQEMITAPPTVQPDRRKLWLRPCSQPTADRFTKGI